MEYTLKKNIKDSKTDFFKAHRYIIKGKRYSLTGFTVSMNQNGGIHKGGFAVLCHRNGGSESPGILNRTASPIKEDRSTESSSVWSHSKQASKSGFACF